MEGGVEAQLLLDDGDQDVGSHGAPDLRFHGVLAGAEEAFDAQVLLDPLEEQFDLPTTAIELCEVCCEIGRAHV